jgi:hypothetical protein
VSEIGSLVTVFGTAVSRVAGVATGCALLSVASTGFAGTAGALPATAPIACSLVTPVDVQTVFGGNAGQGALTAAPDGSETICQWTLTSSNNQSGFSVQLEIKSPYTSHDFTQQRQIAQGKTKTIKHLGDGAFSERVKQGGIVYDDLWIRKGSIGFRIEVLKDLGSTPLAQLAQVVLPKL